MADPPTPEGRRPAPAPRAPKPAGGSRSRWWQDRRKLGAAIGGGVALVAVAAFAAYEILKRPPDVENGENVPFKQEKRNRVSRTTNWPMFGYDRARTRWLPANRVKPPFKELWKHGGKPLIEFPPIFVKAKGLCDKRTELGCGGRLFYVDNNGFAYSLDADTGKVIWERRIAELNASSPAYSRGRLFIVNLVPGQILSLDAATGKKSLPGRAESSPVVVGHRVFFGDEDGNLRAFSTRNGHTVWSTPLAGAIKAGPAYRNGLLYVGDYGGEMSAVKARNGQIKWPRRSPSAGSTAATTMAASTASTRRPGSSPGPNRPAAMSTRGPPSPILRRLPRASTSAPTTATSTPSTRRRGPSAGSGTSGGR